MEDEEKKLSEEALKAEPVVHQHVYNPDEEDDDEDCKCGNSCEGCGDCNESNVRGSEYEYLDEGELCYLTFNFDIGNVNINGTITMIEDEDDEEAEAGV